MSDALYGRILSHMATRVKNTLWLLSCYTQSSELSVLRVTDGLRRVLEIYWNFSLLHMDWRGSVRFCYCSLLRKAFPVPLAREPVQTLLLEQRLQIQMASGPRREQWGKYADRDTPKGGKKHLIKVLLSSRRVWFLWENEDSLCQRNLRFQEKGETLCVISLRSTRHIHTCRRRSTKLVPRAACLWPLQVQCKYNFSGAPLN